MAKSQYYLREDGSFIIEDFQHTKPFSNFFPGVAGVWGVPMWVFYVNRGQGVTSFGIESKDKSILEFQPANKAYRLTSSHGFRTFLKVKKGATTKYYEPFANDAHSPYKTSSQMIITSHDLTIEEVNTTLGLKVRVNYFTMPEEPYGALIRRVNIENIGKGDLSIELIDGLPAIVPYGVGDWLNKHISRTVEAWVKVRGIKDKTPYYHLDVEVKDTPEVTHIESGNFYFAFDPSKSKDALLDAIVEPAVVFGHSSDFLVPERFLDQKNFSIPSKQQTSNRTPSALSHAKFSLKSKKSKEIISLTGYAHDQAKLKKIVKQATDKKFIEDKVVENQKIIEAIKGFCLTKSSSPIFDQYCGQTFLDNVLRGGLPVTLETGEGPVVFNVFSRKHGDLERDYNFFTLAPTFLSQGNGNFRDVNQNRRNDVWFNADLKENSIVNFFNLSQADGYNPLVVRGLTFTVNSSKTRNELVEKYIRSGDRDGLAKLLEDGFMPGDLLQFIENNEIKLKGTARAFLTAVLGHCQKHEIADHNEGFWSDHWTYNLDLVESFLALYPEQLEQLLLKNNTFSFFQNAAYVLPRERRYILTPNGVRQYHSVFEGEEEEGGENGHKLRTNNGQGDVYRTTLLVKLLCVIANKVATLDPSGIGVEMEADKPNWYDALNGLPGRLGSAISETFEVKRFAQFVLNALNDLNPTDDVVVYDELVTFVEGLSNVLTTADTPLAYWHQANDLKEYYRDRVRFGIAGKERNLSISDIKTFLQGVITRTQKGIDSAKNKDGLFATYFYHDVTKHEEIRTDEEDGKTYVKPLVFKRHDLPMFLEGFVHALRSETDSKVASDLYKNIRKSELFDKKLGMYKVNTSLLSESEDIGRTRIFPRGWLENESIWLHMEYKYLLELLRTGLHTEFHKDIKTCFVPFLDPDVYGRSVLENSSFIASSSHEDSELHGQGFVARLSGSTAEFLHMWLFMNAGKQPFRLDSSGELELVFEPALTGELFTKSKSTLSYFTKEGKAATAELPANSYAFNFMGSTLVVYHNSKRKNTFGSQAAKVKSVQIQYSDQKNPVNIDGGVIGSPFACDIRNNKVARIDITLG